MGIIEDLLLNARTAVDTVGKKAEKVIDVSKLTLTSADLKAEISKKSEILGRVVYEQKTTGKNYEKSIDELIEKIKVLNEELGAVNEAIASTKQKSKCNSCGSYNVKGAIFCNKCGARLVTEKENSDTISDEDIIDFTEDNFDDDDMTL